MIRGLGDIPRRGSLRLPGSNAVCYALAFNQVCTTRASDRIYQGFSLGFDGSVEEMWMAFSNGATLVVPTPCTARFGKSRR